ncbi:hypothetical protein O0Q50_18840 [Priestia aryabhattai]|uniref:Uncharacterized protein n=1 Tax=Priestia aryabhattai TaxID=412384 RepID=A0AAX6NBX7_PRIAR|nr:hypothetical protein [Priestia aryabhattai]MDU9693236.1 hypothetical protein [Priestia aryabhattai]
MTALGWLIAISMLLGTITLKSLKSAIEDEEGDRNLSAEEKEELSTFLNTYHMNSFPQKIILIIGVGGSAISMMVDKLINLPFYKR